MAGRVTVGTPSSQKRLTYPPLGYGLYSSSRLVYVCLKVVSAGGLGGSGIPMACHHSLHQKHRTHSSPKRIASRSISAISRTHASHRRAARSSTRAKIAMKIPPCWKER